MDTEKRSSCEKQASTASHEGVTADRPDSQNEKTLPNEKQGMQKSGDPTKQGLVKHTTEDDLELPSDEELKTLRRVPDSLTMSIFLVVIVEGCERAAYYGLTGIFFDYLANPLGPLPSGTGGVGSDPEGLSGAFGLGTVPANGLVQCQNFLTYLFPILGAYIADTKWGRYKTICVFSAIYFVGLVIITATAVPSAIRHSSALAGWIVGMVLMSCGSGGIKSNVAPLVADQITTPPMRIKTLKTGERVIVDRDATIARVYAVFYASINIGGLLSLATAEMERYVGFVWAYLVPTLVFLAVPVVLFLGRNKYRVVAPEGSVLLDAFNVIRYSLRSFWTAPLSYYRSIRRKEDPYAVCRPSYYEKQGQEKPSWLKWDDVFVSEVQRTVTATNVLWFFPIYWLCYGTLLGPLISQGNEMQLGGTPATLLPNIDSIALIVFIPIVDIFLYPFLRRRQMMPGPIARITLGFFLGSASMICASVTQYYIYKRSPCGTDISDTAGCYAPINVWQQSLTYTLIALSEIFASITGLEFCYQRAPLRMKSLVQAFFLLMTAFGNALAAALSPVTGDPYFTWLYGGTAIAAFITGVIFYVLFRHLDVNDAETNAIGLEQERVDKAFIAHPSTQEEEVRIDAREGEATATTLALLGGR
ncbi:uncharacterized protein L969DRAFT_91932 [Mixia osmundae IAM 14324]|uniref:Major facilitator superfamily (MFS) profile domain-containing protein n=1 Tax=Mixia osmundae (strain CBS 9802 / IAM 14324 / JCM 22182 / KY 12970) TaxID=764103 RepID=G7E339_MIXOS|nr:uncharacterized protein L969DRAFT_91932 [Mixia osmundae IAM 14324]KEI42492.1 hypothetical protein L969DRAFT_91932 [Mixia osmundae IAM 14324]GAA97220.1 hypothetical protein E5Q_03896 [Mixia osmundae IAM 14324]